MTASERVSSASRPLTIYYAVAQAGKAIVAAHSPDEPPRRHGLSLPHPSADLMSTILKTEDQRVGIRRSATQLGPQFLRRLRWTTFGTRSRTWP